MATIDLYTDPAEIAYIKMHAYHAPYFAPGELRKIENYEQALADNFVLWDLHHRKEIAEDGSEGASRDVLIVQGEYFYRPADELLFITKTDHKILHYRARAASKPLYVPTAETRTKQSEAKLKSNNTEKRYAVVSGMVARGETLSFTDYAFYRRYCQRNGLPFTGAKVDKTGTLKRVDVPKAIVKKEPCADRTARRYKDVLRRLDAGELLPGKEFSFLRRYCMRRGLDMPPLRITADGKIFQTR